MVALALSITVATAEVRTREDAKGRTVEIIGLADPTDCHPLDFGGTIVKREFAPDALTLTGIVIEVSDGTREFINVEIPKELNMALRGNVYRGLQQLTRIGRKANGRAFACGVAGRVQTLDAIR
jgi:hypothetical protein